MTGPPSLALCCGPLFSKTFRWDQWGSNTEFVGNVFESDEVDADVFTRGDEALFDCEEGVVLVAVEEMMEPPRVAGFGDVIDAIRAEEFAELRIVWFENRDPVEFGDGMDFTSFHDRPPRERSWAASPDDSGQAAQ